MEVDGHPRVRRGCHSCLPKSNQALGTHHLPLDVVVGLRLNALVNVENTNADNTKTLLTFFCPLSGTSHQNMSRHRLNLQFFILHPSLLPGKPSPLQNTK